MVQAWYMDTDTSKDQREPHQMNPSKPTTLDTLKDLGVLYYKVSVNSILQGSLLQSKCKQYTAGFYTTK